MSSNIDNESIENRAILSESDKENELLKNQQSEATPYTVEPIAVRTEMAIYQEEPKSFWQKYKVIIILLIVVVLIGVGIGIYLYMDSNSEVSAETKVASGESVKLLKVEPYVPSTSSPAVTETLKSPSSGVEVATPSPISSNGTQLSMGNLSNTSNGPAVVVPDIPEVNPDVKIGQEGGWYRSNNLSSSSSLTSDMPFLSLFNF